MLLLVVGVDPEGSCDDCCQVVAVDDTPHQRSNSCPVIDKFGEVADIAFLLMEFNDPATSLLGNDGDTHRVSVVPVVREQRLLSVNPLSNVSAPVGADQVRRS